MVAGAPARDPALQYAIEEARSSATNLLKQEKITLILQKTVPVIVCYYGWHYYIIDMIRKLKLGEYRIYSRKVDPETKKRKNLGTFNSMEAAKKHEKEIQYFKHH